MSRDSGHNNRYAVCRLVTRPSFYGILYHTSVCGWDAIAWHSTVAAHEITNILQREWYWLEESERHWHGQTMPRANASGGNLQHAVVVWLLVLPQKR